MTSPAALVSDPTFQLNVMLWSLSDLPAEADLAPVLYRAGYRLDSIGRALQIPAAPVTRRALTRLTGVKGATSTHPDLWLVHERDAVRPLIELKSGSFGPASSNRVQALKLLASAVDLSPSLGAPSPRPGHVVYGTPAAGQLDMDRTLDTLGAELDAAEVGRAPAGVLGFFADAAGVALRTDRPDGLPGPMREALQPEALVVRRGADDELPPLYLVPWQPGLDASQDPDLRADGLKLLTARVLTAAVAEIGSAIPPTEVTLTGAALLNRATFDLFAQWRDTDRKHFERAAVSMVRRALRGETAGGLAGERQLDVPLPSPDAQQRLIDRLLKADPADPAKNLDAALQEPPSLFDLIEPDRRDG